FASGLRDWRIIRLSQCFGSLKGVAEAWHQKPRKHVLLDDVGGLSQIWVVAPALVKLASRDDRRSQMNKEPPWKRIEELRNVIRIDDERVRRLVEGHALRTQRTAAENEGNPAMGQWRKCLSTPT